jgi:phosphomannomutase
MELKPEGYRFVMGYEEALGYTVGELVRDKDGVGTAVVAADMAQWCKSRGVTLLGYLEEIQREHGLFVASQFNATLPGTSGAAQIKAVMANFRAKPIAGIGACTISAAKDYEAGTLPLPKSNVLAWELVGGHRVTLRPSGTEPKVKVYFEWNEQLKAGEPMSAARARAAAALATLEKDFLVLARERGLP